MFLHMTNALPTGLKQVAEEVFERISEQHNTDNDDSLVTIVVILI